MGLLLTGCASFGERSITHPLTAPLVPMAPIQAGIEAGVLLENRTEEPERDNKTATPIELIEGTL